MLPLKDSRCSFTTWTKNGSLQHPHAHGAICVMRTWVGGQLRRVQRVQMLWAGKAGFGTYGLFLASCDFYAVPTESKLCRQWPASSE